MVMARTPIRTPNDGIIQGAISSRTRYSKVRQLHGPIFVREDIGALYVSVYDTLVMEIDEAFEYLGDVHRYQVLGKLSESLGNIVQRTVLAKPTSLMRGGSEGQIRMRTRE